ncbi:hypothetical protein [Photobacterium kishitanii]|uniref:Uncharacterized protein n=1 Tax=Photobacterium kishitanii TaxID=318456 RepID=A0A2T3KMI0_9GAMM|nr:hypothetical protein [Photobacterium kishitanii]PSV00955.1 hypothetical protein C9J27_02715 [Photobacterium kishitanii]
MTTFENIENLIEKHGNPDLIFSADEYKDEYSRIDENVCEQYAVFFKTKAAGGCIIFGRFSDGRWVVNPSLRFPMYALSRIALASLPFSSAYDSERELRDAPLSDKDHKEFQNFKDDNTIVPNGTKSGDWRTLADISKSISLTNKSPVKIEKNNLGILK